MTSRTLLLADLAFLELRRVATRLEENVFERSVIWVGSTRRLSHGMVLKPAVKYQRISTSKGVPRDNH